MNDKIILEVTEYEIIVLRSLVLKKMQYGGTVSEMKDMVELYDKFNKILSEENTINE